MDVKVGHVSFKSVPVAVETARTKGWINEMPVDFELDSGAQICLLSHAMWERLGIPKKTDNSKMVTADGKAVLLAGKCDSVLVT
jgi:predicted aspartyl protease